MSSAFELSPQRRALLERMLRERGMEPSAAAPIPRRTAEWGPLPLSLAQQRMWFLDQLQPGNPFYNLDFSTRLGFPIDVAALQWSIDALVARHEALRTRFVTDEGHAVQEVLDTLQVPLTIEDLTGLPAAEREARALALATEEARRPFDLTRPPLLRLRLLRLAEADSMLLLTIHHIVCDGWSVGVLWRELSDLYAARLAGRPSPLAELPIQYADFAVWQRAWLAGERLERQLAYWREELAELPTLDLPTDRPRPPVQRFRGGRQPLVVPGELTSRLRELARRHHATLFMVLLAGFGAVLSRYTRQEVIAVGAPVAGRTRPELERLIGFFVNTLALRLDLSGEPSFVELLERTRRTCLDAFSHADVPFERLVDELHTPRDLSRNPLFQVSLQLLSDPAGRDADSDGSPMPDHGAELRVDPGSSVLDILIMLMETPNGLRGRIQYDSDLFETATIQRLGGHLVRILEAAVAGPERPVAELPLLPETERRKILQEFNRTDAPIPGRLLHELVADQAARTPDAVAVDDPGGTVTYRELDGRANALAHRLAALGAATNDLVAVCVPRSADGVIAALAVLKAGAAYLPIDPSYPAERQAFMLRDSGARLVLTSAASAPPTSEPLTVIRLDNATRGDRAATPPPTSTGPDDLAYAIYTSGSTGTPKAAANTHRGFVNLAAAQRRRIRVEATDRVLQFASLSFDASIFELVLALCAGATLCVRPREALLPGPPLHEILRLERISVALLPPSSLAHLPTGPLPDLRIIMVAGEACSSDLVARWAPGRRFLNLYGPTETTIWATAAECRPSDRPPSIGQPIDNVRAYVLDDQGEPVPIGVPGELFVGGLGVGAGYCNRPELTAERFIPDRFGATPGACMYRTGDLARWQPDGTLTYQGRLDHQIKLRGFRIEPGEIEAALTRLPGVREAVVVAREDVPGQARLVAYVVPAAEEEAPGERLAQALAPSLREALPQHLVPAAFVVLPALPVNRSGKVDRAALPAPGGDRPEVAAPFEPASTAAQLALTRICAEVLHLDRVGVHDNFFDLGGDSIRSIQLVSRAQEAGYRLSPRQVFQCRTIADLADAAQPVTGPGEPEGAGAASPAPPDFARARASRRDLDSLLNRLGGDGRR